MPFIAPIVEGQGELEAVPLLLRRLVEHMEPNDISGERLIVNPPIRVKATSFLKLDTDFVKAVALAAAKAKANQGSVLILMDCEDDCPARLGPRILARALEVRGDVRYLVALAHREFETWFVTAAASLRGQFGMPNDLVPPPDPERRRGAKEWLGARMRGGYDPITHQHKFTRLFDIEAAKANPSFRRLCERLPALLAGT